jgi:transcriptional regulator with XRE-family HTH domain
MDEGFDVGGHLARLRRRADLSQRELAGRVGVSQSAIAAYEANQREVSARRLDEILRLGGLRLAVIDASGEEVAGFPVDVVRDNAGRRFPAHLDVQPPDVLPGHAFSSPHPDRPPVVAWHIRRAERDRLRAKAGQPPANDHPTLPALEQRARRRDEERRAAALSSAAKLAARLAADPCTCPVECWEYAGCAPGCPCGCEAPVP